MCFSIGTILRYAFEHLKRKLHNLNTVYVLHYPVFSYEDLHRRCQWNLKT